MIYKVHSPKLLPPITWFSQNIVCVAEDTAGPRLDYAQSPALLRDQRPRVRDAPAYPSVACSFQI